MANRGREHLQVSLIKAEQDSEERHQQEGQADRHDDGFDLPLS